MSLPLVLEAYDNAQFDSHNLRDVPPIVRRALHELLDDLQRYHNQAVRYAGVQIWASIQRHKGDPRWQYLDTGLENIEVIT